MKLHLLNLVAALVLVVCFCTGEVHLPARVAVQPAAGRLRTQSLKPSTAGENPNAVLSYPGQPVPFSNRGGSSAEKMPPYRTFIRTSAPRPVALVRC